MALQDQIKNIRAQLARAQDQYTWYTNDTDRLFTKISRTRLAIASNTGAMEELSSTITDFLCQLQDAEWKLAQEKVEEDAYNADPMFIEEDWADLDDSPISSRKRKKIDASRNARAKMASKQSKPKPFTKVDKELRAKKKTPRSESKTHGVIAQEINHTPDQEQKSEIKSAFKSAFKSDQKPKRVYKSTIEARPKHLPDYSRWVPNFTFTPRDEDKELIEDGEYLVSQYLKHFSDLHLERLKAAWHRHSRFDCTCNECWESYLLYTADKYFSHYHLNFA